MRRLARLTLTALALSGLAACGGPAPQDGEVARDKGDDTGETVFDDTIRTQDRARAVEDLSLGRKSDLDEAIEKPEGDGDTEER